MTTNDSEKSSACELTIRRGDLEQPEVIPLLQEHLDMAAVHSPTASRHALEISALRQPEMSFWTAWSDASLAGCGALKHLDKDHVEIKTMRTAKSFRRQGVASTMLMHLLREANVAGYSRVSLETGSMQAFQPARALYRRFGFEECSPFAQYVDDPNSVYMTRQCEHVDVPEI